MAKQFQFRLAAALKYRQMIEQDKLKDYAQANRKVEEERLRIEEMRGEHAKSLDDVREMYNGGISFHQIIDVYRYMNTVEIGIGRTAVKMRKFQEVADQKRGVLVKARKDKRALEILEERQQETFEREQAAREQAEVDELALQQWRRRKEQV